MRRLACSLGLLFLLAGCGGEKDLDRNALMDPESCKTCHPDHYRQWSGSMHAYAAEDPVFLAMNARGQRETNGDLGDFCVQCHAPMAVREGATTDGLNLDEVPDHLKGVTCFFCHNAVGTHDDKNAAVDLADDLVMRGGLPDPTDNTAHRSEYSKMHDRLELESADLCGSCHDIETPKGVHLERTYKEWRGSLFSHQTPAEQQTCGLCHMEGEEGTAADYEGVGLRRVHNHQMVGVDVALTDFPEKEDQANLIQRRLDTTVVLQLCVMRGTGGVTVAVDLENLAAGHNWPSGASQDRRAWLELRGYLGPNEVFSTGVLPEGTPLMELDDPNLWRFGDDIYDENGEQVHMFWEAAEVESNTLIAPTALTPFDTGWIDPHVRREFQLPTVVDRVEAKIHIRPMGLDVLDELIAGDDLAPEIRDRIPTFTLRATEITWRAEDDESCVPQL